MTKKIVVTGLGIVSPIGNTVAEAWPAALASSTRLSSSDSLKRNPLAWAARSVASASVTRAPSSAASAPPWPANN